MKQPGDLPNIQSFEETDSKTGNANSTKLKRLRQGSLHHAYVFKVPV